MVPAPRIPRGHERLGTLNSVGPFALLESIMRFSKCALVALMLLCGMAAQAQTQLRWNEDELSWTGPTTCSDGSPAADCPITGYRIETAPTATSITWSTVTTAAASVSTYKLTVSAGQHCYRVFALSGTKSSGASNVACDTAEGPSPNPPTAATVR